MTPTQQRRERNSAQLNGENAKKERIYNEEAFLQQFVR